MKSQISEAVKTLREAGEGQTEPEQLLRALEGALMRLAQGVPVRILTALPNGFHRGNLFIPHSLLEGSGLMESGWISHHGIATDIRAFMAQKQISLLIRAPVTTDEPGILIAFDELKDVAPPAFPEEKSLRQMADLVNSLYTRCRLNLQTKQEQQLAIIGLVGTAVTHELRNPISAISMFGKLVPKLLKNETFLKDMAEVVPEEARKIKFFAEQLLSMAKPPQYSFERVDLNEVVSYVVERRRQKAEQANISLTFVSGATSAVVTVDAQAIRHVLMNLIDNAIEAIDGTKEPGAIVVRTSIAGDSIMLEVEDNGPGIPEVIRQRLFRPFASSGKGDGCGLGLAICAAITRDHQGTISGTNGTEIGAIFRLNIPFCASV